MIKIDLHTHSTFSQDGKGVLADMVKFAFMQGCSYYGITEHFNADYSEELNGTFRSMNVGEYFSTARMLQKAYSGKMNILVGGEFGFSNDMNACDYYSEIIDKFEPDFIINSVHSYNGTDYCFLGERYSKKEKCLTYLNMLEESIRAPYQYDIVGHFGYVLRYVSNGNEKEFVKDFKSEIIKILRLIIEKNKILEINSSTYGMNQDTLPDVEILSLYYNLGGRKISFGSDAHDIDRIGDGREHILKVLKGIGFSHITIPYKRNHFYLKIK